MNKLIQVFLTVSILVLSLPRSAYADGNLEAIHRCLASWGKHPFNQKNPKYRLIRSSVKVVGIGNDTEDLSATAQPELVLISPSVNVMTKTAYRLLNPNGWYCFKSHVTVMGKSAIEADCNAHIADAQDGVDVIGATEGKGGVTVLGKTTVNRINCKK